MRKAKEVREALDLLVRVANEPTLHPRERSQAATAAEALAWALGSRVFDATLQAMRKVRITEQPAT